jgi:uncharacterized protein
MNSKPVPRITELSRPYWEGAAASELRVQRCSNCEARFLYPRMWCPKCWTVDPLWEVVSGRGEIIACTVVAQAPYESYAQAGPYAIAIVALEEGPQLMTNIIGCRVEEVRIGMKVVATFEKRGECTIPQFKPR